MLDEFHTKTDFRLERAQPKRPGDALILARNADGNTSGTNVICLLRQIWSEDSKDFSSYSNGLESTVPKRLNVRSGWEQNVRPQH